MTAKSLPVSRPVNLADIPRQGYETELRFSRDECNALADILGVTSLTGLAANVRIKPERTDIYLLRGDVEAQIEQECVVTLDPVVSDVAEAIDLRVRANAGAEAVAKAAEREQEFFIDETDPPEPLEGETVDLAQIAVEFLALGIDPYPRKSGVSLTDNPHAPIEEADAAAEDEEKTSPFGILSSIPLKNKE